MTWLKTDMSPCVPRAMAFGVASSVVTRWPRRMAPPSSTIRAAAGAGSSAVKSRRGSIRSLWWVRLPNAARTTLRKTRASASSGGVLSADTHKGCHSALRNFSGCVRVSWLTVSWPGVAVSRSMVCAQCAAASFSRQSNPRASSSPASRCKGAGRRGQARLNAGGCSRVSGRRHSGVAGCRRSINCSDCSYAPSRMCWPLSSGWPSSSTARARPPRVWLASNSVTVTPASASVRAAEQPAQPPPTTATRGRSKSVVTETARSCWQATVCATA